MLVSLIKPYEYQRLSVLVEKFKTSKFLFLILRGVNIASDTSKVKQQQQPPPKKNKKQNKKQQDKK